MFNPHQANCNSTETMKADDGKQNLNTTQIGVQLLIDCCTRWTLFGQRKTQILEKNRMNSAANVKMSEEFLK
jgi:hypothetical protein